MRILKRGTRGEDVLLWQHFLLGLRGKPDIGYVPPVVRLDGIFGRETKRATVAFQQRFRLRVDGMVGRQTFEHARKLGFGKLEGKTDTVASLLRPLAPEIVREPPPAIARPEPSPPPPAGGANSKSVSLQRLRAEAWQSSGEVQAGLVGGKAVFQLLKDGSGDYVYDEYTILVEAMPEGKSPEAFLKEMALDLNGTIENPNFDAVNEFKRRPGGQLKVGDIVDIDILGPKNGSVILVELKPHYFIFQTIDSDETGFHPENGCREFGFERVNGAFRFYTRGVSRPGNVVFRFFGAGPQRDSWTALMKGISAKIVKLGGRSNPATFTEWKDEKPE
jgi:hypothetical protein